MTRLSTIILIAAGTSIFWSLISLLFHFSGICVGTVAIFTFISSFVTLSVFTVAKN